MRSRPAQFCALVALTLLCGAVASAAELTTVATVETGPVQPVSQNPMLHQRGRAIVDGQGRQVSLQGVSLGGWLVWEGWIFGKGILTSQATMIGRLEKAVGPQQTDAFRTAIYDRFVTEADLARIARAGFNCVRVPLNNRVLDTQAEWKRLDRLLDWCERYHIYAVLDLHLVPGSSIGMMEPEPIWTSDAGRLRLIALWKKIAARYRDRQTVGGYDLINEPLPTNGAALVGVYQQIIRAIREADPQHLIVLEGGSFSTEFSMFHEPLDPNLVYSFHMYTWFGDNRAQKLREYQAFARRQDAPLWVGEFGQNNYEMIRSTVEMYAACPEIVGWAFWTWKKAAVPPKNPAPSVSPRDCSGSPGLMMITMPKDWVSTMDWLGSLLGGGQPDAATVRNGMDAFVKAVQAENCQYDEPMERILLRKRN